MKRIFTTIIIILTLVFSLTNIVLGDNIIDLLEKEKKEGLSNRTTSDIDIKRDTEWKETLDKLYVEKIKIEEEIDHKTGKALSNLSNDTTLLSKTISVAKEDKIEAMKKMIELINKGKTDHDNTQLFTRYISKYAPFSDDQELLKYYESIFINSIPEKNMHIQSGSYNRDAAVQYAYDHFDYDTFNPDYPDLTQMGGDCTNFISQCLYAGGIAMNGSWYCYKKNNTYPKPLTIEQLNYSWDLEDPSPWISAKQFELKYYPIFSNETFTALYVYENKSIIYNKPYYKGDVVQILQKQFWWYEAYHTMVITSYANGDYRLTYHSSSVKDKPLNDIAELYKDDDKQIRLYSVSNPF